MKANEIMIGDWVNISKGNWSENWQVELTDIEMIAELVYLVEPIPLTPEILEKNGFIKGHMFNNVWNYIEDYKRLVIVYTGEVFNIQDTLIEFKHVHELQHILKICGIEKEIIL